MTSNFNSETLLCSSSIVFLGKRGEKYFMRLPLLKDKIDNLDYNTFITFCSISIEDFNKEYKTNFKNRFELFNFYKNNKNDIIGIFNKYFEKYMDGFHYVDDSLYWGNRLVGKEVFETFCDYCAIAAGHKAIKDLELVITDDMDEFEKRRIMNERKIAKTKANGQGEGKSKSLDMVLTGVCQAFGYTYEQLRDKTLYSIYFMYSQLGAIGNYEIGNIAAGNGLLGKGAKHNHWAY